MSDREDGHSPFRSRIEQPTAAPIERVWRLRRGRDGAHCQLRDRSRLGVAAQVFARTELVIARVFSSRASALAWSESAKGARLKAGYKAV